MSMTKGDKNIVGQILAKTYRIERFLGAGTIGTVYVARHVRSGGLYAVKVLHKKLATSPEGYQRFQDEARLIATLRHPHIHPITDFDRDDSGLPFFVMELLEGESLAQRLKNRDTLSIPQVVEVIQQVGSALHTAHRSGIVHRNLKTENIFLVRHDLGDRVTESAKVMDFGLSRFRQRASAAGPGAPGSREAAVHVSDFMAPELLRDGEAAPDGRADQWALAVIAYKSLSGKLPFEEDTAEETQRRILNEPPRPLNKLLPELPAHVVGAINRGMAKRREDRYETTLDFVRAVTSKAPGLTGTDGGEAVPQQARVTPPSGRIVLPAPPVPSAPVRPMSTPPAVPRVTPPAIPVAPPPRPAPVERPAPPAPVERPAPPAPVVVPPAPAPAAPAAPMPPSADSGPTAAPPLLMPPPLLLPDGNPASAPAPSRGPSMTVMAVGGALALLLGIGATFLWMQRKQPVTPTTPEGPAPVVNNPPARPVVEALDLPPASPPETADAAPDSSGREAKGPIPPLRGAGTGELVQLAPPKPATPTPPVDAVPAPGVTPPRPTTPGADPTVKPGPGAPTGTPSGNLLYRPSPGPATKVDPTNPGGTGETSPLASKPVEPPTIAPTESAAPADRPGEKSADDIMRDAQTAYVRGERQRAIEIALQVAERGGAAAPGAWRFIGSAACSIGSAAMASRAYANLTSPDHKQMVVELCQRNGLVLSSGQFRSE